MPQAKLILAASWLFRALKKMVDDSLECRSVTTDRYKREVAVCYVGGEDINRKMVLEGWAVAYTRYSDDYVPAEKEAQRAKGEFGRDGL